MLKPKTRIKLNQPEHLKGTFATIVGKCSIEQPVIGANYIIKPDDPSFHICDEYPYEYFSAFECMFEVVSEDTP